MKLTELQERALLCLYRRATFQAKYHKRAKDAIHLCAGIGEAPDNEPRALLEWKRMRSMQCKGLLIAWQLSGGYVQLTPAGCREAERRLCR